MAINKKLLDILACPVCKGKVVYVKATQELVCHFDSIAYPIRNDIPIMLEQESRRLSSDEKR